MFKEKITIDCISSDLEYWDKGIESSEDALQFMKDKNYDLLVIKEQGIIIEEIITKKNEIKKVSNKEIIEDDLPITELLDKFINEPIRHYFIKTDDEIKNIVTIGDLQKGPARLLLFSLIMNFEIVCIDYINEKCGSKWKDALDKCLFYKIRCRYERLIEDDLDIDLLHCSFLDDKIEIIKNIESFKDICLKCERDEKDIKYLLKKLKRLRNNLAHSNHLRTKFRNWEELLETVKICRFFTETMRKEIQ